MSVLSDRILICLIALLVGMGTARADLLHMKDGRVIEGEITDQGDRVRIRMRSGVIATYSKRQIARIEKKKTATGQYSARLKTLEPDDAAGHLDLARWCVQQGMEVEAERALRIVLTMASPVYVRAKFDLARLLEKRGRLKDAIAQYDELAYKIKHPQALVQSRSLKRKLDRKRAGAYEDGIRSLERRKFYEAVRRLEYAFDLTVPVTGPVGPGVVTEQTVLVKLAEIRSQIDEKNRSQGGEGTLLEDCKRCVGSGWTKCSRCSGAGWRMIIKKIWTPSGLETIRRRITCERCKGTRRSLCDTCKGTHVTLSGLDDMLKNKLLKLSVEGYIRNTSNLSRALAAIHRRIARSKPMFVLGTGRPLFAMSDSIRGEVPEVPISAKGIPRGLTKIWRKAKPEERGNFLMDYGLQIAILLKPYHALADAAKKSSIKPIKSALSLDELAGRCEFVDATRISAMPAIYAGRWLAVNAIYQTVAPAPDVIHGARNIPIATGSFHNLFAHAWRPEIAPTHAAVLRVLPVPTLAGVEPHYPYRAINLKLDALKNGERITLLGRLIFAKGGAPESRFEVWGIRVRLDEKTEQLVARVSKPITFNFQRTPISEVTLLIGLLTGLDIDLNLPPDVEIGVTSRVHRQPLGLALSQMLKETGLKWAFSDGGVRIAEKVSGAETATVEKILKLLKPKK